MCGIFGYLGHQTDGANKVLAGLKRLEYRGYDSWGVAVNTASANVAGTLIIEKHTGKIGEARLDKTDIPTTLAIGHTRWATHGGVTVTNAHPHIDVSKKIAVVHNGIIENYQQLRQELLAKGYKFVSETDTEVFVHLVSDYRKSQSLVAAVQSAFLRLSGLNACAVLSCDENCLVAVRKGSPLVIGKGKEGLYLASDAIALGKDCDQISYLENEVIALITLDHARLQRLADLQPEPINWQKNILVDEDLAKGDYPHFLLKEIHEQPAVLQKLAAKPAAVLSYAKQLGQFPIFVGCGSAYHAAVSATYFLAGIAKQWSQAVSASEFSYLRPLMDSANFVTFLSQSGETIDVVEHLPYLIKQQISFGAIVNRAESTLDRATNITIPLRAGTEQAVLATKSYTAMLASSFLLAHAVNNTLEVGAQQLEAAATELQSVLTPEYRSKYILPVVEKLLTAQHLFVIGRGNSYPAALEAALKIKEVTYLHTEGFAGGELKHGVIALIQAGTPCLVLAPDDDEYDAVISNAIELKSRGAVIIGVGKNANQVFDLHLPVGGQAQLSAVTMAVPIQLLAYELAVQLGNDPDKPRNLAKSVTVK